MPSATIYQQPYPPSPVPSPSQRLTTVTILIPVITCMLYNYGKIKTMTILMGQ